MIAFKVRHNYQPLTVAGDEDMSVLTTHVTAVFGDGLPRGCNLDLHVGGLLKKDRDSDGEHVKWTSDRRLGVGDFISIEIVETEEVSPIVERRPSEPSPGILDGEDVITLLQQEFILLLIASQRGGIEKDAEDQHAAFRAGKLLQLGLLVSAGDRLLASDLGRRFLNENKSRMEIVHRYRIPSDGDISRPTNEEPPPKRG
jgi:hypothetical protein